MAAMRLRVRAIAEVMARAPADTATWLSPSERERCARLHVATRRDQFLAGRWLAREVVAEHGGGDAADWILQERRGQPPAVIGGASVPLLSLSHSGDWIAVASADEPVGIDLEQRRPRDALHRFEPLLLAIGEAEGVLDTDTLLDRNSNTFLPIRSAALQGLFPSFDEAYSAARSWTESNCPDPLEHRLAIVPAGFDTVLNRHVLIYGVLCGQP